MLVVYMCSSLLLMFQHFCPNLMCKLSESVLFFVPNQMCRWEELHGSMVFISAEPLTRSSPFVVS